MKIFIVSETLSTGGAEWFSLRLADEFRKRGNEVFFFVLRPDLINDGLREKFNEIPIISLPIKWIKFLVNLDRVVKKVMGRYLLVEKANVNLLKKYIKIYRPDVVHGHLIESDLVAVKANSSADAHNITTVHGDYNRAINEGKRKKEIRFLLERLSKIAVITEVQRDTLQQYYPACASKMTMIYNGYPIKKRDFDDPDDSVFCFGMIARSIPEKGWQVLIDAFILIEERNVKLLLYGEGKHLDELKKLYTDDRIIFAGLTNDPLKAISKMHVGILPSYILSESLPTTIIEYLAMQKPVIATNVGEVKKMIMDEEGNFAGVLIDTIDKEKMVLPLYEAMVKMLHDSNFYNQKKSYCKAAFEKFSMEKCVRAYEKIYENKNV